MLSLTFSYFFSFFSSFSYFHPVPIIQGIFTKFTGIFFLLYFPFLTFLVFFFSNLSLLFVVFTFMFCSLSSFTLHRLSLAPLCSPSLYFRCVTLLHLPCIVFSLSLPTSHHLSVTSWTVPSQHSGPSTTTLTGHTYAKDQQPCTQLQSKKQNQLTTRTWTCVISLWGLLLLKKRKRSRRKILCKEEKTIWWRKL